MKQTMQVFRSGHKEIAEIAALLGGGIFITAICLAIALHVMDIPFFPMNSALAVFIGGCMALLSAAMQIAIYTNRGVKFGMGRKNSLLGGIFLAFSTNLVWLGAVIVGVMMDIVINFWLNPNSPEALGKLMEPALELVGASELLFVLKVVAITIGFFMIASVIMGMIVFRFGKKGFWSMYVVCLAPVFLINRIDGIMESNSMGANLLKAASTALPIPVWYAVGGIAIVAALVWAVKTALQLEVSDLFG